MFEHRVDHNNVLEVSAILDKIDLVKGKLVVDYKNAVDVHLRGLIFR